MSRITKALLISLLATTALAAPSYGTFKHKHHRHSTGTGGGVPHSTKAPYGLGNSTAVGPTGTGTGAGTGSLPVVYSTVVVLPVQATQTAGAGAMTSPVGVNHGAGGSDPTTDCPPGTVYVTASKAVTVTVPYGGESSTNAAAAVSTPVDSSLPSDVPSAPYGAGNATESAVNTAGTTTPDMPHNTWTAPLISPIETPSSTAAAAASPSTTSTTSTTSAVAAPVETPPASSPAPVDTTSASSPAPVAYTPAPAVYTPAATAEALSSTAAAQAPASPKAPAPAAASTTPVPANAPPPSGVKRGLVYNTASLCAPLESSNAISWAYNWGSSSDGLSSSIDYVPMLWGLSGQQDKFIANTKVAIAKGAKYVMGFNEPDMVQKYGGSEIKLTDAVAGWKQYMQQFSGKAQLGSPAVTNANSTSPLMGVPWIKEFEKQCGGACQIDFYNIHWYGWADGKVEDQARVFKEYVIAAKKELGGKPIWVTEFAALPMQDQTVNKAFMDIVLPWLDKPESGVDRYSYFMVSDGSLVQGGALTTMGKAYLAAS